MASKSSKKVATTFLIQVVLSQILLFSLVRSDEAACGNFCPAKGSVDGWETTCNLQQSLAICGDSPNRDIPSAPSNLKVKDFVHQIRGTGLLGMEITWVLPVNGNFTGLQGFYVSVVKTNYPVGYNECYGIRFDHPLTVSSFASEVVFQFTCLRNIDVDSLYNVTITSIGSNKSAKLRDYHTSNCRLVPEVGGCPLDVVQPENWKPSQPPTTVVIENSVTVLFSTYPWDRWITYKINLRPCDGRPTPSALCQIVNTQDPVNQNVNMQDATGRYSFYNVPPDCYKAHVSLYQKLNNKIVDGFDWPSAPFNVTQVSTRPNEEPITSIDASESTDISDSPQTSVNPEKGSTKPAAENGTTENPQNEMYTKPGWQTPLSMGVIAGVVGVVVAVVLIAFVVKQRQGPGRQSEIVSSTETPGDGLINNMVQNDLTGPGHYDTSGYGGDSVSVYQSECQCCDHAGYPENPDDFRSVTHLSGVTV